MYLFWHVVYWPCLASPTPSRIYLSPPWAARDNASCSTSFACSFLALPSLTHTLKDLPLPPISSREWRVTQYPFCMWSFGLMGGSLTHTLKDLLVSCKVGASNLACHHENGVITRHKDVVTRTGLSHETKLSSQRQGNYQHHSTRAF